MAHQASRRQFLKTTAATGVGYWVAAGAAAKESKSPNEQIAMASVGIGGKGSSDSRDAGASGRMVAICDTDQNRLKGAGKRFEGAAMYTDFRKMLDEMGDRIDAVTVSTPDHTHAPAGLMAMRMGKHCFCQKPMTRTIYEARLMGKVAREQKVATQMGNQGTASNGLREGAAIIQSGALGELKELHTWTNRPIWPQGGPRPEPTECPPYLKWDQWLSVAPKRPYANGYHPFAWRGWWDFGTGALGDMACHTMNILFMALDLRNPIALRAVTSGHNRDSFPKWSVITYEFPATATQPALKMTWYDGGKLPDKELLDGRAPANCGALAIGSKGKLLANSNGSRYELLGLDKPEVEFQSSPGHFAEWVRAIKGGEPAVSNFPDYASPLTELVLLGNLAVWVADEGEGERVQWDAKRMKVKNIDGLEPLIKPTYPKGYTLDT
jgi:predicted dehydrogenase